MNTPPPKTKTPNTTTPPIPQPINLPTTKPLTQQKIYKKAANKLVIKPRTPKIKFSTINPFTAKHTIYRRNKLPHTSTNSTIIQKIQTSNIFPSSIPIKADIGKLGLMWPRGKIANLHPAAKMLKEYSTQGCPIQCVLASKVIFS